MRTIKYLVFLGGVFAAVWIVGLSGVGRAQGQAAVCGFSGNTSEGDNLNTVVVGQEVRACFHQQGAVRLVSDLSECRSSERPVTLMGESGGAPRLVKTVSRQDLSFTCPSLATT